MLKVQGPASGKVHCPICTHTVDAQVQTVKIKPAVVPGQKCPRCRGSLDAAFILEPARAA
jgi:hypothetical protein